MTNAGARELRHQSGPQSTPSARQLRRSNALRIKSNNLQLLPIALRESLLAIRSRLSKEAHEEDEQLTLLEQIKRGVKLKPVAARARSSEQRASGEVSIDGYQEESSNSTILVRVLRQRYLAIQQTDDEDSDDDQSDTSSIESGDLCLVGYENVDQSALTCVLYGSGSTLNLTTSKRRALLETLGEYSTIRIRTSAADLTNDLVIRL